MAYIKKLKDNELVGGKNNTDVYPITSAKAVFDSENTSQEEINELIYESMGGKDKLGDPLVKTISVNGGRKNSPDKNGNVNITVSGGSGGGSSEGGSEIDSKSSIYYGTVPPVDETLLWINTEDAGEYDWTEPPTDLDEVKEDIKALRSSVNKLKTLMTHGIINGDATTSARTDIMSETDTATNPETGDSEEIELDPNVLDYEPTVPNLSIKHDTVRNFKANLQNLVQYEIVYYTDQKRLAIYLGDGVFAGISGSSGGSGGGISEEDLLSIYLEYLGLTDNKGNEYRLKIIDGKLTLVNPERELGSLTDGVYVSNRLFINTVFCGGDGTKTDYKSCDYNFVELANGSTQDINLNGLYLLYTDCVYNENNGYNWEVLPLQGTIKAGSTYLVRGAQCSAKTNTTIINVPEPDLNWYDSTGKLVKFNQGKCTFYLCWGSNGLIYNDAGSLISPQYVNAPYAAAAKKGYIDSVGFGANSSSEGGSPVAVVAGDNWDDVLFFRWFMLDPVSQANKAYDARKSNARWSYVNFKREANESREGNPLYYYSEEAKHAYIPMSSVMHKNIFAVHTKFSAEKPNMVNITFGMQATYKDASHKATRCFNWISVGYYDEYIEYKLTSAQQWTRVYSITENDTDPTITPFLHYYKRLRWVTPNNTAVTTHKVIIKNLDAGEYIYRVGRDNDVTYGTDTEYHFKVYSDTQVSEFTFVQTTDQQAFNWLEYQAWKKANWYIANTETDALFTINTGDITQNGNRENEWMDYWDGRQYTRDLEEMFTIGNNDLCGVDSSALGTGAEGSFKINHVNCLRYYTFELDPENIPDFTFPADGEQQYPIYSLYSFNFGNFHFVSINSELTKNTGTCHGISSSDSQAFVMTANKHIEDWFKKDLQLWKGISDETEPVDCSKCIVYMHEMPFTIVTEDFMASKSERSGSHINTLDGYGSYRWSRLLKQYGIKLVIGGHKHTYSLSKHIYDAPADYIDSNHQINSNVDLMGEVSASASRMPVIQVTEASEINSIVDGVYARYELVSDYSAPLYVMSQATGYKLVSNKEQPSRVPMIPWLDNYFPVNSGNKENFEQHYPTYVRYDLTDSQITVTAKQVTNIYVNTSTKATYNINSQPTAAVEERQITCNVGGEYENDKLIISL